MISLKSMLKEGLLGDVETTIKSVDDASERLNIFGRAFSFSNATCSNAMGEFFNLSGLKKQTKGMTYMNDKIERGQFDKKDKIKMFLNWVDHIKFEDLGYSASELNRSIIDSDKFRLEFPNRFAEYGIKCGVFNKPDKIHIWCPTARYTSRWADEFVMFITINNSYGRSPMPLRVSYEINI